MKKAPLPTRVFVLMSGGVDSSVAAALLVQRGFRVTGIFMKNWGKEGTGCTYIQDERDARRVAAKLEIPFYVLNFEREYYTRVFEPFLQGIRQGITPNPDVFCNQEIKFGVCLEKALALGADMIATGHYARVKQETRGKRQGARYALLKAEDTSKDQTYFLYRLNQFQLSKALFPVGDYTKTQIRAMAKEFALPTAAKPDSQGICFVGESPFDTFLKEFIPPQPGVIVDTAGKPLGTHDGVQFYTIGQRKGLGIGGTGKPLFVAKKNSLANTLTVVPQDHALLYSKEAGVANIHWISGDAPATNTISCRVRFRHQQPFQKASVALQSKKRGTVTFSQKQRAITPGQSMVFYKGTKVLGGGIIAS